MPEPTPVWMVHLMQGMTPQEVAGTLRLEDEVVAFESDASGDRFTLRLDELTRVKRLRASPVLLIRWARDGTPRQTAFYFAPPPPLEPQPRTVAQDLSPVSPLGALARPTKRRHRRRNSIYLSTAAGELKPTLVAWASALQDQMTASRGRGEPQA